MIKIYGTNLIVKNLKEIPNNIFFNKKYIVYNND